MTTTMSNQTLSRRPKNVFAGINLAAMIKRDKAPKTISAGLAAQYPQDTPKLVINLSKVSQAYQNLHELLPTAAIHYAMKCNPNPGILKHVKSLGGSFEIASAYELDQLIAIGVDPKTVLFSNPIKMSTHIRYASERGLDRFAFDSEQEVDKIAKHAPGSRVYVRMAAPKTNSVVASEGKFGVPLKDALKLMMYAKRKGLQPYGISFHVGSQMLQAEAWTMAIRDSGELMQQLQAKGIILEMLDIGGGFPVKYESSPDANVKKITVAINEALEQYVPYSLNIVAEPGRYLVAEAGTMETTVMGTASRSDKRWVHIDVGAVNGLLEALETNKALRFPITDSQNAADKDVFTITGPTCDSQDAVADEVVLSANLTEGDKLFIGFAGAYTTSCAKNFNGFPNPIEEVEL